MFLQLLASDNKGSDNSFGLLEAHGCQIILLVRAKNYYFVVLGYWIFIGNNSDFPVWIIWLPFWIITIRPNLRSGDVLIAWREGICGAVSLAYSMLA